MSKVNGLLRGHPEHIFRQSVMGSVGHIVVNYNEFHRLITASEDVEIRIKTWCGKNLKYGNYSTIDLRSKTVRNACLQCFMEYDPSDRTAADREARHERQRQERERNARDGLPF